MKLLPFYRRIPFRLSVILTTILLVLSGLAVVPVSYYASMRVLNAVNHAQLSKAKHFANEIEVKFLERVTFIKTLATTMTPDLFLDADVMALRLKQYNAFVDYFPLGIGIINPDGQSLIAKSSPLPGLKGLAFDNVPWFERAKKEREVVVSKPYRARTTGQPVIVLALAIRDAAGACVGILAAPILLDSPDFLGFAYALAREPFASTLIVSRPDKMIVASTDPSQVFAPLPKPGTIPMQDKAMAGFTGVGRTANEFGTEDVAAVAGIASLDWYVVVRTPADFAMAPVREEVAKDLVAHGLLIVVVVVTVFGVLTIYFRPLEHASDKIRTVEDLHALPSFVQARNDEIGDLFSAFNALVGAVNERTAELRAANERLEELSQTDALTKVSNRRWFDHGLERLWRAHQRSGRPLSMVILDIDFFKKYNDRYGHLQGDDCLASVAGALNGTLQRATDIFARYGGEEFAAIVENDAADALRLAEAMRRAVERLAMEHLDSPFGIVTVSLGVATLVPRVDMAANALIMHADKALYASKEKGRNRVTGSVPEGA